MPGKRNSFFGFFKRTRKNTEDAQETLLSSRYRKTRSTNNVQNMNSLLGPARSEAWPFTSNRPRTAPAIRSAPDLTAGRSELYPWTAVASTSSFRPETPASGTQSNYLEVLQTASSRGYQAPPRHEVATYQTKSLPLPPALRGSTGPSSLRDSISPQCRQPTMPSSRLSMNPESVDSDESEARIYQDELVSPQLKWQTGHHIVSNRQSTWVSRLERRAEHNKKGRELLVNKIEPTIPEHGEEQ